MLKSTNIKKLLRLWAIATIVVIVTIAMAGMYSNSFFSGAQKELAQKARPMASLNQQISQISLLLATREKQLLLSNFTDTTTSDIARQELEVKFNTQWQTLSASIKQDEQAYTQAQQVWQDYQQFLDDDKAFLQQASAHHKTNAEVKSQLQLTEKRTQNILKIVSGLSANTEQSEAKIAYQQFENTVLRFNHAMHLLMESDSSQAQLRQLAQKLNNFKQALSAELDSWSQQTWPSEQQLPMLQRTVQELATVVSNKNATVYQMKAQQLTQKRALLPAHQTVIASLEQLILGINQLAISIEQSSYQGVAQADDFANKIRWAVLALMAIIIAATLSLMTGIAKQINGPLTELRKGMQALSSGRFETRLNQTQSDNELMALAPDFNTFASTTQKLIDDLDQAKQSLQEREHQLITVLDGVPEAIITLNSDGIIQSTNPHAEQVLGADEATLLGQNFMRFFDRSEQDLSFDELIAREASEKDFTGLSYQGDAFSMWLSINSVSHQGEQNWVCVISDVSAWKNAEQQLKMTSSELDTIVENAMVGIAFMKDRSIVRVNQKFEDIFGYSKEQIIGQNTRMLCADDDVFEQLAVEAYTRLAQGETFKGELEFVRRNGQVFWCGVSSKAISAGEPQEGIIWIFEDITAQRHNEAKLRDLASLDSLTRLPNRSVFNDRLMHAIHKAQRNGKRLAIFFLDLDHFKHINDSLGHKAGDQLLCEVAKRLKSCVREGDTVARLGGDEFTVILEDIDSVQYVAKIAEKVLDSVLQTYTLGSTEVNISPSVGVSLYPADGRDVDVLLRNADAAMYHAKNSGRNNFQFYSAEMNAQAAHRLAMETSLRRAVEQKDFYLHFQPQVNLDNNRIIGAEVLLRWHSEQWGEVSPVEFIPILEDTGLIGTVGEFILEQACQAFMSLQHKLDSEFKIAVNLSGRQFKGAPLAAYVKSVLEKTGMSAQNLELEITESILMEDTDLAIRTLSELSELGVTLAVDDFGTGYSSLSYLKQFPLNVLKIDKGFIDDVTQQGDDAAIVDAILAMSGHLNLDVVAEGIETKEQLLFLQQRHCHRGQGYYFSRPLNFEHFARVVEEDKIAV